MQTALHFYIFCYSFSYCLSLWPLPLQYLTQRQQRSKPKINKPPSPKKWRKVALGVRFAVAVKHDQDAKYQALREEALRQLRLAEMGLGAGVGVLIYTYILWISRYGTPTFLIW